jgi:hypothetical protein
VRCLFIAAAILVSAMTVQLQVAQGFNCTPKYLCYCSGGRDSADCKGMMRTLREPRFSLPGLRGDWELSLRSYPDKAEEVAPHPGA